jgi:hypothetical protein
MKNAAPVMGENPGREFDFAQSQHIPASRIRALADMTARLSESWEDKRRQVACCPRK